MSGARGRPTGSVHFLVPEGVDVAARVSGGNVYDLALRDGLKGLGWDVRLEPIRPGEPSMASLLSTLGDGSLVLVDGLLAAQAPDALVHHSRRLRLVALAHMISASVAPAHERAGAGERERRALRAARRVVTTSRWTRDALVSAGAARAADITVARPGVSPAPATVGSSDGGRLLCVGALAPHKGQDVLVHALSGIDADVEWTCTFVGSLDTDRGFAAALRARVESVGLADRIRFTGVLTGGQLLDVYAAADLLVAPSRAESFGMAVADAVARGIPVFASRTGGLPEAIGGSGAGVLVPPDDPSALRAALLRWWTDAAWRSDLRARAERGRLTAPSWLDTARTVAAVLADLSSYDDVPVAVGRPA